MKKFICIVCPRGCHLTVDEENGNAVSGNKCPRGEAYAISEVTNPTRTVTSTVKITGIEASRCPVKTQKPIPKGKVFEVMKEINKVEITSPVKTGDTVIENVCGTGVNVIATKSM